MEHNFEFPILNKKWMCFDTETTGLSKWDDVLQLTCIDSNGKVVDEYFNTRPTYHKLKNGTTSVRRKKTWKDSMAVHHITPEMVKDKLSFYERRDEFKQLFKQYPILLGYNVRFDINAIWFGIYHHVEWYSCVIDVFHLWKMYKEKHNITTANNKLTTVAAFFGYDFSAVAHNSKEDVYATIFVFSKIIEDDEFFEKCISLNKGQMI